MPTDDQLLSATAFLLQKYNLRFSKDQTIIIHNQLAQGNFQEFADIFGENVEDDFKQLKIPQRQFSFQQDDNKQYQNLQQFDSSSYQFHDDELFIEKVTISTIFNEICMAGDICSVQQYQNGVLVAFIDSLSAKVFMYSFSSDFAVKCSKQLMQRKITAKKAQSNRKQSEPQLKPSKTASDNADNAVDDSQQHENADFPENGNRSRQFVQNSASSQENGPRHEKYSKSQDGEGAPRKCNKYFKTKNFVQILLNEPISLGELKEKYQSLANFDNLYEIYQRDDKCWVLLFKEYDMRIQFGKEFSKSDGECKFLKLPEFQSVYYDYKVVWNDPAVKE